MADLERMKRALINADKAGDQKAARRLAAAIKAHLKANPETSIAVQGMSGVNEGIANLAGAPVDLMTMGLNAGIDGVNAVSGGDIPRIEEPFGGSETFKGLLDFSISDVEPQTAAQRYARSIGREAGEMAIPVGATLGKSKKAGETVAAALLSATGAGGAGQAAEDILPDQPVVRALAEVAGGMSPIAVKKALRQGPQAPTMDQLRASKDAAYQVVDDSPATINRGHRDRLMGDMVHDYYAEGADELLHPKATRALDNITQKTPLTPTIAELDKKRQYLNRDVVGANDVGEQRVGKVLRNRIDEYLNNLGPENVSGPEPDAVVKALHEGRELHGRIKRAELVTDGDLSAAEKAARRAASSGTGGNEVNAIRQNIRAILDSPKKRRGFSTEEIQAMEDIVSGTPTVNAMRLIGRLSPTSGALPLAANIGAGAAAVPTGGLSLLPGFFGEGAKQIAEAQTRGQVSSLSEMIRNGGPVARKTMTDAERRIVEALLASQAATAASDR